MKNVLISICVFLWMTTTYSQDDVFRIICSESPSTTAIEVNHQNETYIDYFRTSRIGYIAGKERFKIYCKVNNSDILSVEFLDNQGRLFRNIQNGWFLLFDDGTHGDELAGDKVFTIDSLEVGLSSLWSLREGTIKMTFADGSNSSFISKLGLTCIAVDTSKFPIPEVIRINDDVQYTDYLVNIKTTLSKKDNKFYNLICDEREVAKRFYEFFEDDRDFIAAWTPFPTGTFTISNANGSHVLVRNSANNLGWIITDRSLQYGSNSVLQSFITIYNHQSSYDGFKRLMNHEMLHRWCCHLPGPLSEDPDPFDLHQRYGAGHWNPVIFKSSGFGGGGGNWASDNIVGPDANMRYSWDFSKLGREYNSLELYMMGLLPEDSVDVFPTKALRNPVFVGGAFTADTFVEVSHKLYFDTLLPREPVFPNNQKHFKIAGLAVYDRLMEPVEFAAFHYYLKELETPVTNSFYWATKGRGSVETKLVRRNPTKIKDFYYSSSTIIYPNPVYDELLIDRNITFIKLWVTNIYGQKIQLPISSNKIQTSELLQGHYTLWMQKEDKISKFHFIKI